MAKYAARDLVFQAAEAVKTGLTSVASTDLFTLTSHGFAANDAVVFVSLTGGTGLVIGKKYYVRSANLAANTFEVSATQGGTLFDHTTNVTAGTVVRLAAVAQATALGEAGSTRDLIDASAYGDAYKDYVTGQQDGEEVSIELALDPADTTQALLKTAYDAGTKTYFGLRLAAAAFDVTFPAMVTNYARGGERDGLLRATVSLKIVSPGVLDTP